jgi:hypothetical protein
MRHFRWTGLSIPLLVLAVGLLVATASPASAATLVARWNMDGTGSSMSDSTGRGHTGTLHHVTVGQPGLSGSAYGFSGKPSYVTVPSSGDFSPGTGNFRFTLAVRFPSVPSASVTDFDLLRRGLSSTTGGSYKLEILRSGRAFCDYRGSSGEVTVTGTQNLANNKWHTITCARVGNSVVLTVDGASVSRGGSIGSLSNSTTVYIGSKDSSGNDQYIGLMDSISVTKG